MENQWIDKILEKSSPVVPEYPEEAELAKLLVDTCYAHKDLCPNGFGKVLASAFDLLVAGQYYGALSHTGWLYCPSEEQRLFFHYTNCCPRDVLGGSFHFHQSNKPRSGRIGTATSRLLLLFYQALFKRQGFDEEILKGVEPVDAVILSRSKSKVLFAEIKASPLLTLPVCTASERLTKEVEGEPVELEHCPTENTKLFGSDIELLVPQKGDPPQWKPRYFKMGRRNDAVDREWGVRGLVSLIEEDATFFPGYFNFWNEALKSYYPKSPGSIFWLTNACGAPSPTPSGWPERQQGQGHESVSDSKTSVGMDRTDDIKKGIYQVLKLGSVSKPHDSKWDCKVGLLSNIHAARHFDAYLESLRDIVWTLDTTGKAKPSVPIMVRHYLSSNLE